MPQNLYDELETELQAKGVDATFARLAEHLKREGQLHELFDTRLMESRLRLGLPALWGQSLDQVPEPQRTQMEEAYLAACREIGGLFLADGRLREAWMYLRPTGDKAPVAAALERLAQTDDEKYEELIGLALHEGVNPRLGFELVLKHYGCCNAISMYDAEMHHTPKPDQQAVAALLVKFLHRELFENLRSEVAKQQGREPTAKTIGELVADRDWLFEHDNYHVDTSHLNSVIRFAVLVLEDADALRLAADLCEYGRRLSPQFQYPGEEPFADNYPSHSLYFRALMGEAVDEAVAYFGERARAAYEGDGGFGPIEVYVSLLSRLGRHEEALNVVAEMIPPGARTSGLAPGLLDLARQSRAYRRLMEVSRQRNDPVAFTAGLMATRVAQKQASLRHELARDEGREKGESR